MGCTSSSWPFSKWPPRKKAEKLKNMIFCISTSNYHRFTKLISKYMFLRVTNMIKIFTKWLLITKRLKIQDVCQFWPQNPLAEKPWNSIFCISTSISHRFTKLICTYMFWRVTNMIKIFSKCLLITKRLKIQDVCQFWSKKPSRYEIN